MPLGLDLGTTNSSIAWADPTTGDVTSVTVLRDPTAPFDSVLRSLVFDPLGDSPIIGLHAAEGQDRSDAQLVSSFKKSFDKARLRRKTLRVEHTATGEYDWVNQGDRYRESAHWIPLEYDDYSLDEVVQAGALILRHLLAAASDALNGSSDSRDPIRIGVPVSFGPTARRRLLRALVDSGHFGPAPDAYRRVLRRCRLVYEPLALMATLPIAVSQTVLVVDYGGGTLDLALVRVEDNTTMKELALGGLDKAGDRLDEAFREHLCATRPEIAQPFKREFKLGGKDRRDAVDAFSKAKVDLSTRSSAQMWVFGGAKVTRRELQRAIGPDIDEAVAEIHNTLARGGLTPVDVDSVVLTGGSSLIPLLQERVRGVFDHLDDYSFVAGIPGDTESERETLTGVSRGLARYGFVESFETSAPCTFSVVVPGTSHGPTTCLERGAPDVVRLSESPSVAVPVAGGRHSFVLYSDLLRDTYCGALVDVALPDKTTAVNVRVSASRERFAPAFHVAAGRRVLARFDLESMSAAELEAWAEGDCEWLPTDVRRPSRPFLVRPLALGDFIEWRSDGMFKRGLVTLIRDKRSHKRLKTMNGMDPSGYLFEADVEVGNIVKPGRRAKPVLGIGDVRLA